MDELNRKLVAKFQAGDKEALKTLIEKNYGLCWMCAHKRTLINPTLSTEDLAQQGVFGLVRAAEKYNPKKGSFANYACIWVRNFINVHIKTLDSQIRVPINGPGKRSTEEKRIRALRLVRTIPLNIECMQKIKTETENCWEEVEYFRDRWEEEIVPHLSEKELIIITGRMEGTTLDVLGKKLKLSKERIRQIEEKIIKKAKNLVKYKLREEL